MKTQFTTGPWQPSQQYMAKHFKGPWIAENVGFGGSVWQIATYVEGKGTQIIAEIKGKDYDQKQKNAALIAAAPDLLESLDELLGLTMDTCGDTATIRKAIAAITKARGAGK